MFQYFSITILLSYLFIPFFFLHRQSQNASAAATPSIPGDRRSQISRISFTDIQMQGGGIMVCWIFLFSMICFVFVLCGNNPCHTEKEFPKHVIKINFLKFWISFNIFAHLTFGKFFFPKTEIFWTGNANFNINFHKLHFSAI